MIEERRRCLRNQRKALYMLEADWRRDRTKGYAKLLVASFLAVGVFVAAVLIVAPQIPITDTVTISSSDHIDYVRVLSGGQTVNIDITVLNGTPPSSGETVMLYVMDHCNYELKMSGAPTYYTFLEVGATLRTNTTWHTPSANDYYFVLENLGISNATVAISIQWEVQWVPGAEAAALVGFVLIMLIAIGVDFFLRLDRLYAQELMEFSGDLDIFAESVTTAPQRLHPVTLTVPHEVRCAVCNSYLGENDQVSFCPHCGSPSHSDHLLKWLSRNKFCPACASHQEQQFRDA